MVSSTEDHQFGALNTLLLVAIFGICIFTNYITKQNAFYYLPESTVAICIGLIVGGIVRLSFPSSAELAFLSFDPDLFFFLLLPPIIFEAAYSLRKKEFFDNFWTISLFAVLGTVISTFIVGYMVFAFGLIGIVSIDTSSPLESLLFGSLISAIDPVATLSIMGNADLKCNPLLYSLIFGESVLNDAVSVVLFKTFFNYYKSGASFTHGSIPLFMINFLGITIASVMVGIVTGLICSFLCKQTQLKKYPEFEILILGLFAYGSYSMSEAIEFSGIMSLFFCGIVLNKYNSFNLSNTSKVTAHTVFKSLGTISELFVYLYIGMGVFTDHIKPWNVLFACCCLFACVVGRFMNIFPLSFLANYGRAEKISLPMQLVMWFAGLRGAIAFALSLNMPDNHYRGVFVTTTLTIVLVTTLVCGALTEPVLNITTMRAKSSLLDQDYERMGTTENGCPDMSSEINNPIDARTPLQRFDEEVMMPMFGGPSTVEFQEPVSPNASLELSKSALDMISI